MSERWQHLETPINYRLALKKVYDAVGQVLCVEKKAEIIGEAEAIFYHTLCARNYCCYDFKDTVEQKSEAVAYISAFARIMPSEISFKDFLSIGEQVPSQV